MLLLLSGSEELLNVLRKAHFLTLNHGLIDLNLKPGWGGLDTETRLDRRDRSQRGKYLGRVTQRPSYLYSFT